MHHLCVYKLNPEQLKDWGAVATAIWEEIIKKAENHKMFSEPKVEEQAEQGSRKSVPHSTRSSNPEGLLES